MYTSLYKKLTEEKLPTSYKAAFTPREKGTGDSATFEFFIHNGSLFVIYNSHKEILFEHLLHSRHYPQVKSQIRQIAEHIIRKYSHFDSVKNWIKEKKGWEYVLLQFILKYFSKFDKRLDVIVFSNGKIDFNLEA